jgi:integrase
VEALTAEELARVLAVASKLYPEHADILRVLAWTGLRLGEACALQWSDVDLAGRFIEVRRTVGLRARHLIVGAPKSGQARRVDLPLSWHSSSPSAKACTRRRPQWLGSSHHRGCSPPRPSRAGH